MTSPWEVTEAQVVDGFQSEGALFPELMDALIHAERWRARAPIAAVHPNQRGNYKDGGVDTLVQEAFAADPTGLLDHPSIWQYKSGPWGETQRAKLGELLGGDKWEAVAAKARKDGLPSCTRFLLQRLNAGDSLRVCVAAAATAQELADAHSRLAEVMREFSVPEPTIARARVVSAAVIAGWASRYSGIVRRFFGRQRGLDHVEDILTWRALVASQTPVYVPNPDWEELGRLIERHVDLATTPADVILRLCGPAGAGKTRFILETLSALPVAPLVIYAQSGGAAQAMAMHLARDEEQHAILVADDCFSASRAVLRGLRAFRGRLRVIAIDNAGDRPRDDGLTFWAPPMSEGNVRKVLAQNFDHVEEARRVEVARIARGAVFFAAELCSSPTGQIPASIEDYLDSRFARGTPERRVLDGLSLLTHVEVRGKEREQVEALGAALGVSADEIIQVASHVHEQSGLIRRGDGFFYVTPDVVAHTLAPGAWNTHVAPDVQRFLDRISSCPPLVERLSKRLSSIVGMEGARNELGTRFRGIVEHLTADALRNAHAARFVTSCIEADPDTLLPVLRTRIEAFSREQLVECGGDPPPVRAPGDPHWGPRRYLVWLAEGLAGFDEYFDDASRILLRLADAESEPSYANNATGVWRQLHRIAMSGTARPFPDRLRGLVRHARTAPASLRPLVFAAFEEALSPPGARMASSQRVVGGRVVPDEWIPATLGALQAEQARTVDALMELSGTPELAREVRETVLRTLPGLLHEGHGDRLRALLGPLSDGERTMVRRVVEQALEFGLPEQHRRGTEDWLAELAPRTIHERLVRLATSDLWEPRYKDEIGGLVADLQRDPAGLSGQLDFLAGEEAVGGFKIGRALGRTDPELRWAQELVRDALRRAHAPGLTLGYLDGVRSLGVSLDAVNALLDEGGSPRTVLELAKSAGPDARPVARALAAVRSGAGEVEILAGFTGLAYGGELTPDEVSEVAAVLLTSARPNLVGRAIELLDGWLRGARARGETLDPAHVLYRTAWEAVSWRPADERPLRPTGPAGSYPWCNLLERLAPQDPPRAAPLVARAFGAQLRPDRHLIDLVQQLVELNAVALLESLGAELLGPRGAALSSLIDLRGVVEAIPEDLWRGWLDTHGLPAARALARHLPVPRFVDDQRFLPPLTELVLGNFGEDDRVFREFSAGVHGVESRAGDLAAQAEEDARLAAAFLDHPLACVRRWARDEERHARAEAEGWRAMEERDNLGF